MKNLKKIIFLIVTALILIPGISAKAASTITIDKKSYIYTDTRKEAKFHTTKGYAYCITPHRTGPAQGTSLSYKSKQTSGGVLYLLEKAGTSDSEYLATQLAIWQYDSNYMPEFYLNHSSYDVVKKAKSLANEAAKNKNYTGKQPSVKINASSSTLTLTSDGKYYRSGVMTVTISNAKSANLELSGAPSGATIVNANFNAIKSITGSNKFYVQIPADKVTKNGTFTVKATSTGQVSVVERYSTGNTKWQDLVVLVKENKTVSATTKLSVTPVKRTCEIFNGKYYDKNGNETDKTTYSIQCEKHTCEVVGNVYFGSDGKQTDQTTYSIQCEKHTCEVVGNVYFGSDGKQTDKTNYSIQCEKHSCEKVGSTLFGKNGNQVDEATYNLECNTHTCEKVGDKYFGKNSYEVDETTYNKECFQHTCEKVGDTYFGQDGTEVDYGVYTVQCEKHTCEYINGVYFGNTGSQVTEDEYINQCIHTCEIYNNQYYGSAGNVVTEAEYKAQCETAVVPVPDTASGGWSDLISVILGSAMLGAVGGILAHTNSKKHA